jgi:hypothetical protein
MMLDRSAHSADGDDPLLSASNPYRAMVRNALCRQLGGRPQGDSKPDVIDNLFLSVGAMKAGTSWLFKQLEHHPDIYSNPVKEVHYFGHVHTEVPFLDFASRLENLKAHVRWLDPACDPRALQKDLRWFETYLSDPVDDRWFLKLFHSRTTQKYCADYSNLVCILDDAGWNHVSRLAKNVKVLYTLRDPLKRLWSHVRFHYALSESIENLRHWNATQFEEYFIAEGLVAHGNYASNIATMRRHLGADRVLVCFFEDFRSRPARELEKIESFLEISNTEYKADDLRQVHNPSQELPMAGQFIMAASKHARRGIEQLALAKVKIPETWSFR